MKIYPVFKRISDYMFSMIAILVLWPFFVIIGAIIKIDSKGPIFLKQKRVGKLNKEFNIIKFRTMRTDTPKDLPTHLLHNSEIFITKVGKFLRKSSIDELPQIINVVKGEMSIIGPRPALWNQYDLIAERDKYGANDILPGLTGWAQVNGRDELPIAIKAEIDGYYVKNISLILDAKIFLMTIIKVLAASGVVEGERFSQERIEG